MSTIHARGLFTIFAASALLHCNVTREDEDPSANLAAPDAGPPASVDSGPVAPPPASGAVTVLSSGNRLPDPWVSTDAAAFHPDGAGAASAHKNELVRLDVSTTASQDPCPLPYTNSSGKTYCDGFNALGADGHTVVVDTFGYLGTNPPCKSALPTSGTVASVSGIWQDKYDAVARTNTWTLVPMDCSCLGLGTPYLGDQDAPASTAVRQMLDTFVSGSKVTVRGLVLAKWSANTAHGFVLGDPGGGAGIQVKRGSTSTAPNIAPNVGDWVEVTGTAKNLGSVDKRIDL